MDSNQRGHQIPQTLLLALTSLISAKNIFANPFGRIAKMLYICSDIQSDCKDRIFYSTKQIKVE